MTVVWSPRAIRHLVHVREYIAKEDPPYIIPYRLKAARLEILAVLHFRQRWPDHL